MVFTSKTLIPGKQPIGQNGDGSYIYDGVQSKLPPKPITVANTGIPNVGIPGVKGLTTPIAPSMSSNLPPVTFSPERAKEINSRPTPTTPTKTAPTGTIIPIEEKKRRVILMEQQGGTQEDIQAYLDYLKSQETSAPVETQSLNDKINKGGADFLAKGISGAIRGSGNLAGWAINAVTGAREKVYGGIDAILPGDQSNLGKIKETRAIVDKVVPKMKETTNNIANKFENLQGEMSSQGPINQESLSAKAGDLVGKTVPSLLIGGGVSKIPALTKLASTGLAGRIGAGAITGAAEGAAFSAADTGEVDPKTVAGFAATGGVLPFVGAGLSKAKNFITKALPKSMITTQIATPTAILNASKRLSKLSDNGILDIDKAPEWMLTKGLSGNKTQIKGQLTNIIKEGVTKKSELLKTAGLVDDAKQVSDLKAAVGALLPKYAKVTKKSIDATPGNEETVSEILKFLKNKKPTVNEFEKFRLFLGDSGIFKQSGDWSAASSDGLQKIWVGASKYMDSKIPGFRVLNKDIEVARALGDAIGLKEAQDLARGYGSLVNVTAGGAGAGLGYAQTGDWKGAASGFVGGLSAKYLLNNPAVLTRLAQGLSGKKLENVLNLVKKTKPATKLIAPAIFNK